MPELYDGQQVIQLFFTALERRYLEECAAALVHLQTIAHAQPAYAPWCAYLDGVLANERDNDWGRAERIFRALLPDDTLTAALRGRVLMALGLTYTFQSRWSESIQTYETALALFTEMQQPVDQAKAWKQIALCLYSQFMQGETDSRVLHTAIDQCQQALDILAHMPDLGPDIVWLQGSIWNTLGLISVCLQDWEEAIRCYEQDIALCRTLEDEHGIGISSLNLGEVYHQLGPQHWEQARHAYQEALRILRAFDDQYLEIETLANLGFLQQAMGMHQQALHTYAQALDLIESLRAGASSEAARAGFFATVVDTYAHAVLLCLEMGQVAQAFDYVERARSRAFLDALTERSPTLSQQMEAATMTLAEVQAALPDDALLLEYFITGMVEVRERKGTAALRHRFPPERVLLFAITHDHIQVHTIPLPLESLRPSRLDNVVERHFLPPKIRQNLYQHLLTPVEDRIRTHQRLYLVPHGPLHYIPFQALIAPDDRPLLREDSSTLVYAPGATILLHSARVRTEQPPRSCLALGYNGDTDNRLQFAEEEAQNIAHLTGGHALTGASVKKPSLYQQAHQYRLLHFSCHGEFNPRQPLESALHLAHGEQLTALDILEHLRLNCDLVILSACESGLSRIRRGDELVGLVRAFLYAGTPALLSTLWRVDERSTRILVERFYQEAGSGADFATALKRAQLFLMRLTRREADELLAGFQASEPPDQPVAAPELLPDEPPLTERAIGNYLKSTADAAVFDPTLADADHPFADPYYWAAFVLVGGG
ncbi:MAG: CHAT domain-containing protein [Chloroflexaceae bacterium]|nr:CHAT domain-containing protein [Chloroflexaceae bacterium]